MPPSWGGYYYYYTSLPASWVRHFMPFPVLFYAVYLWQHSEEVGIENKKGWNMSGWWFFCFVIPVWSVLKIVSYGMEVSFGMYHTRTCFAMGRSKMKPLWMWDGGNCRTTLTKWPMGMSENWWYTRPTEHRGPAVVGRKVGIDDKGSKKPPRKWKKCRKRVRSIITHCRAPQKVHKSYFKDVIK